MERDRRVRVHVSGKVQGVFFRQALRAEAVKAGVAGWVRNLDDGRVEAVIEGPAAAVAAVAEWCRHGPAGARVSNLDMADEEPAGEALPFTVGYGS